MKNKQQTLEEQIYTYIGKQSSAFTIDDTATALQTDNDLELEELRKEAKAVLESNCYVFAQKDQDRFISRKSFFANAKFSITPSAFEIEQGIFIPGHRLIPFISQDVFPSESKIALVETKQFAATKTISIPVGDIGNYHLLMGTEDMINFLEAEDGSNAAVIASGDFHNKIKLTVFDLSAFYKSFTFKPGDCLLFEVQDWEAGVLTLDFMPQEDKDNYDHSPREWAADYEKAILSIIDELGNYITIPEQLARAFFSADNYLLQTPIMSVEDCLADSEVIGTVLHGNHSVLDRYDGDDETDDDEPLQVPDGFMISKGKTESLDAIFEDIKVPLKAVELEAFMNDELYKGGESLDAVLARATSNMPFPFVDEGQEAVYQNFIDELWEAVVDNYNRFSDKNKGALRERILEVTETRLQWLQYLRDEDLDSGNVPNDKLEVIAECSARFSHMLNITNREQQDFADEDMEQLTDAIEDIADLQQANIDAINKIILK